MTERKDCAINEGYGAAPLRNSGLLVIPMTLGYDDREVMIVWIWNYFPIAFFMFSHSTNSLLISIVKILFSVNGRYSISNS